jgi:hypothetical protein
MLFRLLAVVMGSLVQLLGIVCYILWREALEVKELCLGL